MEKRRGRLEGATGNAVCGKSGEDNRSWSRRNGEAEDRADAKDETKAEKQLEP